MLKILKNWLFGLSRLKKSAILIFLDVLIIVISLFLAYFMRLENTKFFYNTDIYIATLIAVSVTIFIFGLKGLYKTFNRHISIEAAYVIIFGGITSCFSLILTGTFFDLYIPRSVPFIYGLILFLLATSMRFSIRTIGKDIYRTKKIKNIAIYGAGYNGLTLMKALKHNPNYKLCQFIDDNEELHGQTIDGIPIYSLERAKKELKKLEIKILLIAISNYSYDTRQRIFDILYQHQLSIKSFPSIDNLINTNTNIDQLQDLNIEDLLSRRIVMPDENLMSKNIIGKTVLITGAGGSIGSELCRQILAWRPNKIILLDISESSIYNIEMELNNISEFNSVEIIPLIGSVQDSLYINNVLKTFKIDTLYHAAAYKHVPLMEQNIKQCMMNNVLGTYNVLNAAISQKVKNFILVSTDKAVNPPNFMGASKRMAEIICLALSLNNPRTIISIVRFGNVLGSSGSVVPLFKNQINKGGPITLSHPETTRYFMTIPEAAQLVIQASSISKGGEVFILDMGKQIKILDLAKKMVILSGFKPVFEKTKAPNCKEIEIIITGLRPGEKLHEKLSYSDEVLKTIHHRINIAKENKIKVYEIDDMIFNLKKAIDKDNYEEIISIVSSVVPYISKSKNFNDVFILNKDFISNNMLNMKLKKSKS